MPVWGAAIVVDLADVPTYTAALSRAAPEQSLLCETRKAPPTPGEEQPPRRPQQPRQQQQRQRHNPEAGASVRPGQQPQAAAQPLGPCARAPQKENERPSVSCPAAMVDAAKGAPAPSRPVFSESQRAAQPAMVVPASVGCWGRPLATALGPLSSRSAPSAAALGQPLAPPMWGAAVAVSCAGLRRGFRSSTGPQVRVDQTVSYQS